MTGLPRETTRPADVGLVVRAVVLLGVEWWRTRHNNVTRGLFAGRVVPMNNATTADQTADDREVICSQFLDATLRTYAEPTYDAADDPYATEYDR